MSLNELDTINLMLDQAPCHSTSKVKNASAERNSKLIFIPKRLTCLLQPADVSWMRSLKHSFELKWTDWMTNSEKSFTKSGNMKSPGYANFIQWISEIWQEFDSDLIKKLFSLCGITSSQTNEYHNQLKHLILNKNLVEDVTEDHYDSIDGFNTDESEFSDGILNERIVISDESDSDSD